MLERRKPQFVRTSWLVLAVVTLLLGLSSTCNASISFETTRYWAWMDGNITAPVRGLYPPQPPGVAIMPGSRRDFSHWKDEANRQLWIFGGIGIDSRGEEGALNDLWMLRLNDSTWTFWGGSDRAHATSSYRCGLNFSKDRNVLIDNCINLFGKGNGSIPGARVAAASWMEKSRVNTSLLMLYGGLGFGSSPNAGLLSDVWQYDVLQRRWTLMSGTLDTSVPTAYPPSSGMGGSQFTPGSRGHPITCYNQQQDLLYLFGGSVGLGGPWRADLWTFNGTSTEWTWIGGPTQNSPEGSFGSVGVADSTNQPPGLDGSVAVCEGSNMWIFGGFGGDSTYSGIHEAVWRYNMTSGWWTWVAGRRGNVAAAPGAPGARVHMSHHFDAASNTLVIFGGEYGALGNVSFRADLLTFNLTSMQWTVRGGSNITNAFSSSSGRGIQAIANMPGARRGGALFYDSITDRIMLFGGGSFNPGSLYNDLWTLAPLTPPSESSTFEQVPDSPMPSPPRAAPPVNPNVDKDCIGNRPLPAAVCVAGKWVVNGSVVSQDPTLNITNPIIITGNFTLVNPSSRTFISVEISPTGAPVQIGGCASFAGNLSVLIPNSQQLAERVVIATYDKGLCGSDGSGKFSSVDVELSFCQGAPAASLVYEEKSLILVLGVLDSTACSSPSQEVQQAADRVAVIAGASVAAAVTAVLLVILILYLLRRKVVPAFQLEKASEAAQTRLQKEEL